LKPLLGCGTSLRRSRWALTFAFALAQIFFGTDAVAGDPRLRWYTIENEHVRVHYHSGLEQIAQRAAAVADQMQARLSKWLNSAQTDKTEILLADSTDYANGFANVIPYSAVHLYVTAPDDMSILGDYDDWFATLLSHEQTHIAHTNNISGFPALVNALLGRQAAPIQLQPRFLLEGMAVYAETVTSSGGRLRSPLFDMMLRADVLENNFAPLDQICGDPRRWPGGTIYYLYGAKFVSYLAETYGSSLFSQVATDSGDDVMPFAVSRPFYRATGRTIEELYDGFRESTKRRVSEQLEKVEGRGLREGKRLTEHGRNIAHPRFFPNHCRPGIGADHATILYSRDDGNAVPGYYELLLNVPEAKEELFSRASGDTSSIGADCSVYFDSIAPSVRRYDYLDLFRQTPQTRSPLGTEGSRQRLTVGRRAAHPDVSPDGKQIVYVTNRAGTTTLRIARLDENRIVQDERALVPGVMGEQVFSPRFSHNGKLVVYGTWSRGGYRDLRVVEVASGNVTELWHDRATDQQPVFSPDDRSLYFSSDRSGISNIYRYDFATQNLRQITNVRTGAFMPEPAPDGKSIAYVGYGTEGYDLYWLLLDPSRELDPIAVPIERGDRPALVESAPLPVEPYSAWGTLRPRALGIDYRNDASGQRLILSAAGSDIASLHAADASVVFEPEGNSPDVYLGYSYGRLPFNLNISGYRVSDPNLRYAYGSSSARVIEVRTGASTGVSYGIPSEFSSQAVSLSYVAEYVSSVLPTGTAADPYATVPEDPRRGISSSLRVAYSFSNAAGTFFGSGNEQGISLRLAVDEAHRALGSTLEGTTVSGRTTGYILLPFGQHQVLALSNCFGASTGQAGAGFALGGYQDSGLLRNALDGVGQSRMTLRGYPSGIFRGSRLLLGQAEYRLPLFDVDRGISTLPVFLRSMHFSLGIDAGGAFDQFDANLWEKLFHYGVAAELWFDLVLSYRMSTRFLWGYAAGKGDGAIKGGTGYFVVGSGL